MTERFCTHCKHYELRTGSTTYGGTTTVEIVCVALSGKPSPVDGGKIGHIKADLARAALCGWSDPKWWEARK